MQSTRLFMGTLLVAYGGIFAEPLNDGWEAYNQGLYEEAYDLFSQAFRKDLSNPDINFALGEAAYQKKKYSHAVLAYDRVLAVRPAHPKARYSKALALMALNQPDEARAEFATLLRSDLTPEVRKQIEDFVGQVGGQAAQRWRFEGAFAISAFYDDNINFGPSSEIFQALSGDVPIADANAQAGVFGVGLSASGNASYDVGAQGDWYLIGGGSLYNTSLEEVSADETLYARGFSGVRRVEPDRLTELSAHCDRMDYGNEHLLDIYGFDAAYLRMIGKNNHGIGRLGLEWRDFSAKTSSDGRDSLYTTATATWKHFFTNRRNQTELSATIFSDYANEAVHRNQGFSLRAGGEKELPFGVMAYTFVQYLWTLYDENQKDVFAHAQKDNEYIWVIGTRRPISKHWILDLQYRAIRNDSNLGLYDYHRQLVTLTATYKF